MSVSKEELKTLQEELEWISLDAGAVPQKTRPKGIFGILVPIGCVTTAAILGFGIRSLLQRDSRKQQMLMRYRVLSQGITVAIAMIGLSMNK